MYNIIKKFVFKMAWAGSCIAFMFIMPTLFEVFNEQEAVLDKIQRDDMMAQASDLSGYNPAAAAEPIVRPFWLWSPKEIGTQM